MLFSVGRSDMGEAAVQVNGGGSRCQTAVPRCYGCGNGRMLCGRGFEPGRIVGRQAPNADQMDAQAAHGVDQVGIRNGRVNCVIQLSCQRVVSVAGGVLRTEQLRSRKKPGVKVFKNSWVSALRCKSRRSTLQCLPEIEKLVDVIKRYVRDDDSTPTCSGCESLGAEASQRFTDGSAGDAQPFRLLYFR